LLDSLLEALGARDSEDDIAIMVLERQ